MKKAMIFIFLALFLVSMTGFVMGDNETNQTTNETEDEADCQDAGGTWEQFTNGCVDSCELARESSDDPIACTQAITMGCDCGEDECWNGEACEANAIGENETEDEDNQTQRIKQLKNRLQIYLNATECPDNCTCAGSTIKCWLNGQREMTIVAGRSGNVIVQVKGVNASTNVTLYKSEGKLYGVFEGNETKRILSPEQVQEKIRERKQKRWEEHNITLDEDGYYRVQSKKKARLFFLIPVREKVRTQIDAETGEIIKIRNPWWGFLANDIKEEPLVGASCGTVNPDDVDECCQNKGYDAWDAEAVECVFSE